MLEIDITPNVPLYESEDLTIELQRVHYREGGELTVQLELTTPKDVVDGTPPFGYAYEERLDTYLFYQRVGGV